MASFNGYRPVSHFGHYMKVAAEHTGDVQKLALAFVRAPARRLKRPR